MRSMHRPVTIFTVLIGLFTFASVHAETIDLSKAKEAPPALVDILQKLNGRDLLLVGGSMEQLDPKLPANPITCQFESQMGDKFYVFSPSETDKTLRFAANLTDEYDLAPVNIGPIGGFTWLGLGGTYTYGNASVTVEPGTVTFNHSYTYIGLNVAIPGTISTKLQYVFELSSNSDLSGTKIKKTLTVKGGGVNYKRSCDYLVK